MVRLKDSTLHLRSRYQRAVPARLAVTATLRNTSIVVPPPCPRHGPAAQRPYRFRSSAVFSAWCLLPRLRRLPASSLRSGRARTGITWSTSISRPLTRPSSRQSSHKGFRLMYQARSLRQAAS